MEVKGQEVERKDPREVTEIYICGLGLVCEHRGALCLFTLIRFPSRQQALF